MHYFKLRIIPSIPYNIGTIFYFLYVIFHTEPFTYIYYSQSSISVTHHKLFFAEHVNKDISLINQLPAPIV